MTRSSRQPAYLFTAFEPSGDAHAAPVIRALKERQPEAVIVATGGPKMEAAGATMLAETVGKAAMGLSAAGRFFEHRQVMKQVRGWLDEHGDTLHALIPVDSPAANWSLCALVRKQRPEAKVYHLVAPQLWAWGAGRVKKLKRLSDHVLCLLPFEPDWFAQHGMPATFIGHPLFEPGASSGSGGESGQRRRVIAEGVGPDHPPDRPPDQPRDQPDHAPPSTLNTQHSTPPSTPHTPRLALLPGSRAAEVAKNWPTMLAAFTALRGSGLDVHATVAAHTDATAQRVGESLNDSMRPHVTIETGKIEQVLDTTDAALVVSGTASLQTAAHRRPMVVLYNVNPVAWHVVGRHLIQTRTFSLPNLISDHLGLGRVVPEFVPHFGDPRPIAAAVGQLLTDEAARERQAQAFDRIAARFAGHDYAQEAAGIVCGR